jgi:hypothetical protein
MPQGATQQEGTKGVFWRKIRAHIGILCINTGGGYDPGLLLVLIEHQGVRIEATMNDVESGFVCDTVTIAKGRGAGVVCTGHVMEKKNGDDAG